MNRAMGCSRTKQSGAVMMVMLVIREISEDYKVAVIFGVMCIISVWLLILLFRRVKSSHS